MGGDNTPNENKNNCLLSVLLIDSTGNENNGSDTTVELYCRSQIFVDSLNSTLQYPRSAIATTNCSITTQSSVSPCCPCCSFFAFPLSY